LSQFPDDFNFDEISPVMQDEGLKKSNGVEAMEVEGSAGGTITSLVENVQSIPLSFKIVVNRARRSSLLCNNEKAFR
jgi:hypothetical protein